jgi:hypothetical protein
VGGCNHWRGLFPIRWGHIWQGEGNLWLGLWGLVRLEDIKKANDILGLITQEVRTVEGGSRQLGLRTVGVGKSTTNKLESSQGDRG